jgi:hypothetical protein
VATIERIFESKCKLTIFTVLGRVAVKAIMEETAWFNNGNVTKNVLWDFTGADVSELFQADISSISTSSRNNLTAREGGKTAIVAQSDLAFGISRMYGIMMESQGFHFNTMPFRDMDKAMEWIKDKTPD